MLYGLSQRTADQLKRVLTDGGAIGAPAMSGVPARGVTWVKVTDAPDGDGWHPAVVSLDQAGAWWDLTAPALVAASDGSELVPGQRYLCTRTGDSDDGEPRFRTTPTGETGFNSWSLIDGDISADDTWEEVTTTGVVTLPREGLYLVWASVSALIEVSALTGTPRIRVRLLIAPADGGTVGEIQGTRLVVASAQATGRAVQGTATIAALVEAEAGDALRLSGWRDSGATYTTARLFGENAGGGGTIQLTYSRIGGGSIGGGGGGLALTAADLVALGGAASAGELP